MNFFSANRVLFSILGVLALAMFFHSFFLNSPTDFPVGTIFKIEQGSTLRGVSQKLKDEHFIRSRVLFEAFMLIFNGEKRVIRADYYFESKLPVYEIARRIGTGEHRLAPVVVTIPEGFNINQIADVFDTKLENFDKAQFLLKAKGLEGQLFPDTYFFLSTDSEGDVLKSMSDNFNKKIKLLEPFIAKSGKTEKEIIVMASLIEGEAEGDSDRGFISGILWKRISINMPLQVDVAPETYKMRGLPNDPIGNPGLAALKATIFPQSSPYLYYLHDKNGVIHYARTFNEHIKNKLKYLR